MNEIPDNKLDKFNQWVRSNKFTAALIVVGTIVIALSTFTNAARNLIELLAPGKRVEVNGVWEAEINYDWARATYTETFSFEGEAERLFGFATFLTRKRVIDSGEVNGNRIQFITKGREVTSSWDEGAARETVHHYSATFENGELHFVLQIEGGYSVHQPIEFLARKVESVEQKLD